uniref:Uncharacterized protein n=1 Tax=Ditylenchus dipsaci TaxID=166011 RepID=A0A915D8E4_9BILA
MSIHRRAHPAGRIECSRSNRLSICLLPNKLPGSYYANSATTIATTDGADSGISEEIGSDSPPKVNKTTGKCHRKYLQNQTEETVLQEVWAAMIQTTRCEAPMRTPPLAENIQPWRSRLKVGFRRMSSTDLSRRAETPKWETEIDQLSGDFPSESLEEEDIVCQHLCNHKQKTPYSRINGYLPNSASTRPKSTVLPAETDTMKSRRHRGEPVILDQAKKAVTRSSSPGRYSSYSALNEDTSGMDELLDAITT